jgi:hypothetical protein
LLARTLDLLADLGPLPARSRSSRRRLRLGKTRQTLTTLGLRGQIAHKGEKPPIRASRRWHLERTNAWHNAFNRFQRCYERREKVIDTFLDLADTIIAVRSLIRRGLDHPPLGHPTYPATVINTSIRATSSRAAPHARRRASAGRVGVGGSGRRD